LNDGQTCKAGTYECVNSKNLEPSEKITSIGMEVGYEERVLMRIDFYDSK